MLEYNEKKNILYAYKNEQARPSLIPDTSHNVVVESFNSYVEEQVKDDVLDIFLPALLECFKVDSNAINIERGRIVAKQVDPGKFNDLKHHVTVRFNIRNCDNSRSEDVSIINLPHVHEDGTIEYENKRYAFIHMLEQESAISFEANEDTAKAAMLKVKNDTRSFWIDDDARVLKIRFSDIAGKSSKTKYSLINLVMAMARVEGYDVEEVWSEFANFSIVNMFKDDSAKATALYYSGGNTAYVNASEYEDQLVSRLTLTRIKSNGSGDDSYNNECVRDDLNRLLSLDRAIGEELAKDVYSVTDPNTLLYRSGTIIDDNSIRVMQANGVYCIYVKYIPNTEGYFLCEDVSVMSVPAGLRITPSLRDSFPDEKGMYTSRYYDKLPVPIIYEAGSPITSEMIQVLQAMNYDSIKVSDKKTGGIERTLYFYEEIISNRQVHGYSIGKGSDDWYYLDVNNNWRLNDGSYTTYDFVALQSFCVKLFDGKWIERVVNLDDGFRKRLVPIAEQYHRAFAYAVRNGFKQMGRKLKNIYTESNGQRFQVRDLVDNEFYPFEKFFWKYLRDEVRCVSSLSSDSLHNPIAYQSACTKVNVYTANKHSVSDSQRGVAIGSYGKLDQFEIPQSGKMGTVYNQTCGVKISIDGKITTGYHPVKHVGDECKIMFSRTEYMTSEEEEQWVIGDLCAIKFDESGRILNPDDIVSCRVPSTGDIEKHTFRGRRIRDIEYVSTSATQTLSWASATIPFMSSNDAARAIFADAQLKQAKGLVNPEEPDVMTSAYEQFVWLNDKFGIVAKGHGRIDQADYEPRDKKFFVSVVYDWQDGINTGTVYEVPEYFDSGYSVTKMRMLVKPGQEVNKGDMILASNFISDNGILTVGYNALTGYICDGYNYEDGTHVSTTLCEKLTSYRLNREEFAGTPRGTREYRVDKWPKGRWIHDDEDSKLMVSYRDEKKAMRQKRAKVPKKAYGFVEDINPIATKDDRNHYGVEVCAVSIDKFGPGDKLSNRHGNKGVASRVEPAYNMPRLKNGMPLELTHNPLGVGSRMNIGQVMDIHSGLVAHVLGFKLSADAYNSISLEELHTLMSLTVDLMDSTGDPRAVTANYPMLSQAFLEHCVGNIENIRKYAGCFDKDGTTQVMLPDNEGRMTETRILVGYIYVFKLIQEAHKKVHARAGETYGEAYGELTDAPTHGSSKGGGQRYGTMEIDALCAMGASGLIHELTNERCDNAIARNNFYVDAFLPPKLRKQYKIDSPGQRRSVTQFLYSMLALGVMCEPTDGEFLPLSSNNGEELAHWKPSVIQRANPNYMVKYDKDKKEDTTSQEDDEEKLRLNARNLILGNLNM